MLRVIVVLAGAGSRSRERNLDNRGVTLWSILATGSSSGSVQVGRAGES